MRWQRNRTRDSLGLQKARRYWERLEDGPFMILGSGETVCGGGGGGRDKERLQLRVTNSLTQGEGGVLT